MAGETETPTRIEDGGAAFPVLPPTDPGGNGSARGYPYPDPGMSLRDYFAAQAIPTLIFKSEDRDGGWSVDTVAAGAYAVADAMIRARSDTGRDGT